MLAKFAVSACLVAGAMCTTVFGQQSYYQSNPTAQVPAAPVAYSFQQDQQNGLSNEDLEEMVKRLSLRLAELENDVQSKIEAQPEAEKEDKALSDRVKDLEKGIESTDKSVEKLEDTVPGLVFHSHKTPKLQLFGRIHLDYWSFPKVDDTLFPLETSASNPNGDPQDRVIFRRMRLGVKGDLNDNVFYKFEAEFANGAASSYRDAYLGYKNLPFFHTVILGNQKRPYGLDHLNSSRHNIFIERPFIVEAFNQDSRRLGVTSNGVSEDQKWNWRYGYYNQELTQNKAGRVSDYYAPEIAARLAHMPWYDESSGGRGYAHFALSGSAGVPQDQARYRTRPEARSSNRWLDTSTIAGARNNYLMGVESVINVGSLNLTGEYMRVNVNRDDAVGEDVAFDGYYAQASYMLTGEHHAWNRETGTLGRLKPFENAFSVRDCDGNIQRGLGAWEIAYRFSRADLDNFDILGGRGFSNTFGINWYWNPYARMQFNYINGEITEGAGGAGQGDYEIFGVRWMVDF